jgi:hypothetical protein
MPDLQLIVFSALGTTFHGTKYLKGNVIPVATDTDVLNALAEIGSDVEITRTVAPGGHVPLHTALRETWEKLLPSNPAELVLVVDTFENVPTASTNAFLLAKASAVGAKSYTAAQLDGAVGAGVSRPARNVTVTVAGTTAAESYTSLTVTGEDINGKSLSETIAVTAAAATYQGNSAFRKITNLAFTGGTGAGATVAVGFGNKLGFSEKTALRDTKVHVVSELQDGVHVGTAGTLAVPTVGLPNGTYTPNAAPDAAKTYTVVYESAQRTLRDKKRGLLPSP